MKSRTASQTGRFSRRKGKRFENWVARYFTQWTGLKWETTRNSGRTDLKGDIYCLSRPDLPLVVECKHRKEYSVHAMLKPTKAFQDMVKCYNNPLIMIIIKNETGVWIKPYKKPTPYYGDLIQIANICVLYRLQHIIEYQFEINGVKFDASGMDSVGEEGEGQ